MYIYFLIQCFLNSIRFALRYPRLAKLNTRDVCRRWAAARQESNTSFARPQINKYFMEYNSGNLLRPNHLSLDICNKYYNIWFIQICNMYVRVYTNINTSLKWTLQCLFKKCMEMFICTYNICNVIILYTTLRLILCVNSNDCYEQKNHIYVHTVGSICGNMFFCICKIRKNSSIFMICFFFNFLLLLK